MINLCICNSGKKYADCCQIFHKGTLPQNALQLMRSRYSAYALNYPEYIVDTTHPANPQYTDNFFAWKRDLAKFSKSMKFQKLVIHDFQESDKMATVTFTAYLLKGKEDATFTEKSYFAKAHEKWFYLYGSSSQGDDPHLVNESPFPILPLAYFGTPILRQKAISVEGITGEIKQLVKLMIATMDASNGMGIAAPQVHQPLRIFVIRQPLEIAPKSMKLGDVKVFINPRIKDPSTETWIANEGCLSIPGIRMPVERPKKVTIEYLDLEGNFKEIEASDWEAKVILHEFDHIQGVLFIDRLKKEEKANLEPYLRQIENRMKKLL